LEQAEIHKVASAVARRRDDYYNNQLTTDSPSRYASTDKKFIFSVQNRLDGVSEKVYLQYGKTTGELRLRTAFFKFSEMTVYFWLFFGFVRNSTATADEADNVALSALFAAYPNSTRKEYTLFYTEYNKQLEANPTEENIKRSAILFEKVTDKIMAGL